MWFVFVLFFVLKGDAFTFDAKRKFALFGGKDHTALVHLDEPSNVIKQYPLGAPHKWSVSNYEWDPLSLNGNERFLQTVTSSLSVIAIFQFDFISMNIL